MHAEEHKMPILLVTSCRVSWDRLISAHVAYVHTVTATAREQLHGTAQHLYSCVEVCTLMRIHVDMNIHARLSNVHLILQLQLLRPTSMRTSFRGDLIPYKLTPS